MSRVGYFDFENNTGTFVFAGGPVRGFLLLEAIRRVTEGPLFQGEISYEMDHYVRRDVSADLKMGTVTVTATTALGSGFFDLRDAYTGIEVFMPDSAERSHVLCAFCYEVALEAQTVKTREFSSLDLSDATR